MPFRTPEELAMLMDRMADLAGDAERQEWLDRVCGNEQSLRQLLEEHWARRVGPTRCETPGHVSQPTQMGSSSDREGGTQNRTGETDEIGRTEMVTPVDATQFLPGGSVLQTLPGAGEFDPIVLRPPEGEAPAPSLRPLSRKRVWEDLGNRYELHGELARGGMGLILQGRDLDLGRELAIKVLHDSHLDRPEVVQRFVEEAQIQGQLQHPGVVPVHELGMFTDKRPFFSMKLVTGETLAARLKARSTLPDQRAVLLKIFEQVCQTMAYVHSRGVIHRDLKPTNIMVGSFGEALVMDWGLAKLLGVRGDRPGVLAEDAVASEIPSTEEGSEKNPVSGPIVTRSSSVETQVGSILGTLDFMPPEQAVGQVDSLDERVDVFALGAILCNILTGQPPYVGANTGDLLRMASQADLADCHARLATCGADQELLDLTRDCLSPQPSDRPRDAGVVSRRVTGYLASLEQRLHESELSRAAEEARAEEVLHTMAETEARAQAERRLKQLQLRGIRWVAALLMVGTLATAGVAWYQNRLKQGAERARQEAETAKTRSFKALVKMEQAKEKVEQAKREETLAKEAAEAQRRLAESQSKEAIRQRKAAENARDMNRRSLYRSQMPLAAGLWEQCRGLPQMSEILRSWRPSDGQTDLRGWEWHHLEGRLQSHLRRIDVGQGYLTRCEWNPQGTRLAAGSETGRIVLVEGAATGPERVLEGHTGWVSGLGWHPDGDHLISASHDQTFRIWNAATGECLHTSESFQTAATAAAFSPDGNRFAIATGGGVSVRDYPGRQVLHATPLAVEHLAWLPDGRGMVLHGSRRLHLWNLDDSDPRLVATDNSWRSALALSPDGRLVAVPDDSDIVLRELPGGTIRQQLRGHRLPPLSLHFSPDGRQLAAAGEEFSVHVWNLNQQRMVQTHRGQSWNVSSVRWHPRNNLLASTSTDLRIWDPVRNEGALEVQTSVKPINSLSWSPDGRFIALAAAWGTIEVVDAHTGITQQLLTGQPGNFQRVAWHPRRPLLVSTGDQQDVTFWNPQTGQQIRNLPGLLPIGRALAWSPDGCWLAAGGGPGHGKVVVISAETLEVVGELPGADSRVHAAAWNHDGTRLAASASDGQVRIWDIAPEWLEKRPDSASPRPPHIIPTGHLTGSHWALAWNHRGDRLAAGGQSGKIALLDTNQHIVIQTLDGHTSILYGLDWSSDDSRLASCSHDNTVRIWDTRDQAEILVLRQGRDQVGGMAFSPDSSRLAFADSKGFLHILDAPLPHVQSPASVRQEVDREVVRQPGDPALRYRQWQAHRSGGDPQTARQARQEFLAQIAQQPHDMARIWEPLEVANRLVADSTLQTMVWRTPEWLQTTAESDADVSPQPDGFLLAGPIPQGRPDVYHLRCRVPPGPLTGLRLDVQSHASLPGYGSGWGDGNFHLSGVRVEVRRATGEVTPLPLAFAASDWVRPLDGDTSPQDGPWGVLDDNPATHWDVWPIPRTPHWLAIEMQQTALIHPGDEVLVQLQFHDPRWPLARLGNFRMTTTADRVDFAELQVAAGIQSRILPPWDALVAGCLLMGETTAAGQLLAQPDLLTPLHRAWLTLWRCQAVGDVAEARRAAEELRQRMQSETVPRPLEAVFRRTLERVP